MSDEKKSETIVGLIKEIPEFIMKITNWLKYFTYRLSRLITMIDNKKLLYLQENYNRRLVYRISIYRMLIRNVIYIAVSSFILVLLYKKGQQGLIYMLPLCMLIASFVNIVFMYKDNYTMFMKGLVLMGTLILLGEQVIVSYNCTKMVIIEEKISYYILAIILLWLIITFFNVLFVDTKYKIDKNKKCIDINGTKNFVIKNGKKVIKRIKIHDFGVYIENKDVVSIYNFKDNEITKYTFTNIPGMRRITSIEIGYTIITSSNVDDYI